MGFIADRMETPAGKYFINFFPGIPGGGADPYPIGLF
jgi:hypothetical protein